MVGIVSFGAYIPIHRLEHDKIAGAWGLASMKGEKAVANYDEDSLTMGVEAAIDCINGLDRDSIDGVCFASTTAPYAERQSASTIVAALDFSKELLTADFANSVRASTSAIRSAVDAINGGSAKKVIVIASDMLVPAPQSENEQLFGNGVAAILLGESDVAVEIQGFCTTSSEFTDRWRLSGEQYYCSWEDRFVQVTIIEEAIERILQQLAQKYSLKPEDFSKVILNAPNPRRHRELARKMNLDGNQVQDSLLTTMGNTGTAHTLMMLVAALEEAKAGDKLLLLNYGDGCDAYILQVTPGIEKLRNKRAIKRHLASKMMLPTYEKYFVFRDLMDWGHDPRPSLGSSLTVTWRDRDQIFALYGAKCKHCGEVQYPVPRVCAYCQTKDQFERLRLSDKRGTLFTFSVDERAQVPDPPTVASVVDLDIGGRLVLQMTDRDVAKVDVGMPVEMTFRNMHEGSGFHNYFWKCRPIRC